MKKMLKLLKQSFDLWCKMRWLKTIDKECDKYNKLKRELDCSRHVISELLKEYNKIYGVDLREREENAK